MQISWLKSFADSWNERLDRGRVPHALLLIGPPGVGKRCAAAWIAGRHLGLPGSTSLPQHPLERAAHADLRWIEPPEDKAVISIEQVRGLVGDLSLTSYEGRGKVAVIAPANVMTVNAANSLLKTLEEPPGNTLLLLVADRIGRLPATIMSRCQRVEILPPPEQQGRDWLDRLRPGGDWTAALELAGYAPLAAIDALDALPTHETMSRDFVGVSARRASVVTVAEAWSKMDPGFVLEWLARQVQAIIYRAFGGPGNIYSRMVDDSVLQRMDRQNLFCYLDIINRLRAQPAGSFNVQLALESLLVDLADGLRNCRDRLPEDGLRHLPT